MSFWQTSSPGDVVQSCDDLLREVRACTRCEDVLPLGPRPVLQIHPSARILLAAQAPGRRVHETGLPFNDPSGDRLRHWLGISRDTFYDASRVAIVPMGFCFPGKSLSGDLPPRPECALAWRDRVLAHLCNVQLTLVIGQYAQAWHLPGSGSVTQAVRSWRDTWPVLVPMPHPSPRNALWLRRNPWFEEELLPLVRARIVELIGGDKPLQLDGLSLP